MKKILITFGILMISILSCKSNTVVKEDTIVKDVVIEPTEIVITKNGIIIDDTTEIINIYKAYGFNYDSTLLEKTLEDIDADTTADIIDTISTETLETDNLTYEISYNVLNQTITDNVESNITCIDYNKYCIVLDTNTNLYKYILDIDEKTLNYNESIITVMCNINDQSMLDSYMIAVIENNNHKTIKIYNCKNGDLSNYVVLNTRNNEIVKSTIISDYIIKSYNNYPSKVEKIVKNAYKFYDREYTENFVLNAFYNEHLIKINNKYTTIELLEYYNNALFTDVILEGCLIKKGDYITPLVNNINAFRYIDSEKAILDLDNKGNTILGIYTSIMPVDREDKKFEKYVRIEDYINNNTYLIKEKKGE